MAGLRPIVITCDRQGCEAFSLKNPRVQSTATARAAAREDGWVVAPSEGLPPGLPMLAMDLCPTHAVHPVYLSINDIHTLQFATHGLYDWAPSDVSSGVRDMKSLLARIESEWGSKNDR